MKIVLVLMVAIVSGCSFTSSTPKANNNPIAEIIYLIPTDESQIEDWAKPEELIKNKQTLSISATSDWEHVNQLANDKKTLAVIIHHSAIDQVNKEELAYLFKRRWFVVTGIGIDEDELKGLIDMPNLFVNNPPACCSTPPAFFLAYSYRIEGSPEDIEIIETSPDIHGDSEVEGKVGIISHRDTNSLLGKDEVIADMLLEIENQIRSVNRKDIYGTE